MCLPLFSHNQATQKIPRLATVGRSLGMTFIAVYSIISGTVLMRCRVHLPRSGRASRIFARICEVKLHPTIRTIRTIRMKKDCSRGCSAAVGGCNRDRARLDSHRHRTRHGESSPCRSRVCSRDGGPASRRPVANLQRNALERPSASRHFRYGLQELLSSWLIQHAGDDQV